MFESIIADETVHAPGFFLILFTALLSGGIYSFLSCYRSKSSKSFAMATALLPMAVAAVILLVNGNLGIGVAIAGAFGLVRFRSAPGTAKEIAVIFIAMAAGLAFGMGFLSYGMIFLLISGVLLLLFDLYENIRRKSSTREKIIKVTIPESLDYTSVFDEVFEIYTTEAELEKVKSTNMGSMFHLTYRVKLKSVTQEKLFLDALRTRNGNLEIICSRADCPETEL